MRKMAWFSLFSVCCLLLAMIIPSSSDAQVRRFHRPTVGGIALDWCLTWAQNCGQAAADNFCRWQGYDRAVNFRQAPDIGYTRILRTGQICNQRYCDGFAFIDCARARPAPRTFNYPMIKGYRLDWCRTWARDCGGGAAHAYCRSMGYSRARSWQMDPDIGLRSATYVIHGGQICNQRFCDGFRYIVCE
jgi:hypothetical protein